MITLYTIGHSTRSAEEFVALLKAHGIRTLVDIRSLPGSRRLPHFDRQNLARELAEHGIEYIWIKELGGRRGRQPASERSPNLGLRNQSFRNYADYMLTPEFHTAAARLEEMAGRAPTAIMCAEAVFFRCHRMLVSDFFTLHGHQVLHIQGASPPQAHRLTAEAQRSEDDVVYPARGSEVGQARLPHIK